jgi:hypothetical protein
MAEIDWVVAKPVLEHVQKLNGGGSGMPLPVIAQRANVPKQLLYRLIYGRDGSPPSVRIDSRAAGRILAVEYDPVPKGYGANSIGAKRRLEALHWKGWSWSRLERAIPLHSSIISEILNGSQASVRWEVHNRIIAFYDHYWLIDGGNGDAKRRARERHFAPPGAWDVNTVDDWRAEPDPGVDWAA